MPIASGHRHFLSSLLSPRGVLLVLDSAHRPPWVDSLERDVQTLSIPWALLDLRTSSGPAMPSMKGADPDQAERAFELAILATGGRGVVEGLRRAARCGAQAAVVLAEHGDPEHVREWTAVARELQLRLLGPASMGLVRPSLSLNASRMGPLPVAGHVALISQSGVLNGAILDWSAASVIGFSLVVSLGGEADVDMAQVLDFVASDPETRSVVVYLEAVRESRSFMSALRALSTVKPVVILKGHRDDGASQRALTHSGALCGSDAVYTAALRRAGAVQVRLFTQLFTTARLLAGQREPTQRRLAVISNGSGPAVLAADLARGSRLLLPALSEGARDVLSKALPRLRLDNPLNLGVGARAADYGQAIEALAADRGIDALLVMLAAYEGAEPEAVAREVIAAARRIRKPLYACWMGDRSVRSSWKQLDEAGIPVFRTPETAVDAHATIARFHYNQQLLQQTPRPLSDLQEPDLEGARLLIESVRHEGRTVLTEMESKALLGAFHIPVTRTVLARSANEAMVLAQQIGFPVVMKIASPDISHKSEVGGVVMNVRSAAEVRTQYSEILASAGRAAPDARLEGVTLQATRGGPASHELFIGVSRDPLFGPVIAFGAGGRRVESMRDTTLELPPLNRFLARQMIERTRIAQTLGAFAGAGTAAAAVDLERVETLLVRVSEMVCELPALHGMDINPFIADESGVVAVDARVVIDNAPSTHEARYRHMAIMPYPSHLAQAKTTPDGRLYTIRPIAPEDADRLQAFMRALSPESRYFRFISALSELPPRMLYRYTQIDYDRELALVAVVGPEVVLPQEPADGLPVEVPERIVGVVRYLLNPDRETCEFAVAVADDWQGRRLGSTLMRAIIEAARDRGLRSIEGFVLGINSRMLDLMRHLGFSVRTDPTDATMKIVTLSLESAGDVAPLSGGSP